MGPLTSLRFADSVFVMIYDRVWVRVDLVFAGNDQSIAGPQDANNHPSVVLFSVIALEKFAQTSE